MADPDRTLFDDFLQLLGNGKYSDITLLSEEGTAFKVHRNILSQRCEVFRAKLEHDDVKPGSEVTTPFDEVILRQILTYIYTARVPNPAELTPVSFAAADYYQLPGLKKICVTQFHTQLTVDNAITMLELAEKYSQHDLFQYTLEFLKRDKMHLFTQTESWKNFKPCELMKIIVEFAVEKPPNWKFGMVIGDLPYSSKLSVLQKRQNTELDSK